MRTDFAPRVDEIYQDEEWWSLLESLLLDADPAVRSAARVPALYQPADTTATRARFTGWSSSSDAELRLAGLLGLAQLGDLEATLAFLDTLAARPPQLAPAAWAIPVLWIVLAQRRRNPQFESLAPPDLSRTGTEPEYLGGFAAELAADLRGS